MAIHGSAGPQLPQTTQPMPSAPRACGDPRWQSRGICIASLASQEEEGVEVLKKTSRKEKDLSRGQGDERTLEKRMLLIQPH
jgi:hypothetical protein